jgi:hypothetical protein
MAAVSAVFLIGGGPIVAFSPYRVTPLRPGAAVSMHR